MQQNYDFDYESWLRQELETRVRFYENLGIPVPEKLRLSASLEKIVAFNRKLKERKKNRSK